MKKNNRQKGVHVDARSQSRPAFCISWILLILLMGVAGKAGAQNYLRKLGGLGGGSFNEPCPAGQNLTGFDVRTGDDVDAIRPVCAVSYGPTEISTPLLANDSSAPGWHGGSGGGRMERVLCPPRIPIVLGIDVMSEGAKTTIVNSIMLFCGQAVATPQTASVNPSAVFEAPYYVPSGGFLTGADPANRSYGSERCDKGQVAIGMHGRSGIWLDAMGLICDTPRITPRQDGRTVVKSLGRLGTSETSGPPVPICDAARAARARNSPAAPNLEAQCNASTPHVASLGRLPPSQPSGPPLPVCDEARAARERNSPATSSLEAQCRARGGDQGAAADAARALEKLAAAGETLVSDDPLLAELRSRQLEPNRRGFDIGIAAAEGQTQWGSGKQKILDSLNPAEQEGFKVAVSFALDRNRNAALAAIGAAIADADPTVAQARTAESDVRYWLGFDIATGIFGDPAQGANGNTATGPGSMKIRDALSAPAQRGFNASVKLHLSRRY